MSSVILSDFRIFINKKLIVLQNYVNVEAYRKLPIHATKQPT